MKKNQNQEKIFFQIKKAVSTGKARDEAFNALSKEFEFHDKVIEETFGKLGTESRELFELESDYKTLGEIVKSLRKSYNLTQEQLGSKIGAKKSHISKIENGNPNMTLGTIQRLFAALEARITFKIDPRPDTDINRIDHPFRSSNKALPPSAKALPNAARDNFHSQIGAPKKSAGLLSSNVTSSYNYGGE